MRVDPELGGSCGDASVLLVSGEVHSSAVVAPRRCLGPILAAREICVVPETLVALVVDSRRIKTQTTFKFPYSLIGRRA